MSACCAPSSGRDLPSRPAPAAGAAATNLRGTVAVPGGRFLMGSADADAVLGDGEGPVRDVNVSAFAIDAKAVTNAQFASFVKATGYHTDAEEIGWSFVFHHFVHGKARGGVLDAVVPGAPWWLAVKGATWRRPEGPGSDIARKPNHPVVHVSWNDASAYAVWIGKRLPSEAEWEKAARGGLIQARFPWGDAFTPRGQHRCNTWQGQFPHQDTGEDGYVGTAPVDAFRPNGYGLYNTSGNVWEWCADWFSRDWHAAERPETRHDPRGPEHGDAKVIRGGSHLCHESYCNRYRVSARTHNTPDSSSGHTGFRCAADTA